MSPRIAVELTSERPDGTWTWRAAGARQPKGVLEGKLLPAGVVVGEVLRVEADIDIDGITVTTVLPPKGERRQPERLAVIGPPRDEASVTTTRVERGRTSSRPIDRSDRPSGGAPGSRRPERARPDRTRPERDRPERPQAHRPRPSAPRPEGDSEARRPERRARPPRPEVAPRPKPKKLRPRRVHRDALLAGLPQEQLPIAEQALRGGMPAVRAALGEQNAEARREGKPEAPSAAVLAIAEALLPRVRVADWLDRAEAALADVEELALADLRSVVVSADDVAREEQTREIAATLRAVLERRTQAEQAVWQRDLEQSLESGRVVRALRLSSRAPQPGERLAPEVVTRLSEAAGAAMTAEIAVDRWATLLDAVAYSAVRRSVTPAGVPPEPGDELLGQVRKHAGRLPAIAGLFGIQAPTSGSPRRPPRRRPAGEAPAGPPVRPGTLPTAAGSAPPRPRRIPPPPSATPPTPGPTREAGGAEAPDPSAGAAAPVPEATVPGPVPEPAALSDPEPVPEVATPVPDSASLPEPTVPGPVHEPAPVPEPSSTAAPGPTPEPVGAGDAEVPRQ